MELVKKHNPKDLSFSAGDRKVLLKYLEKFYTTNLYQYNYHLRAEKNPRANKTNTARYERKFRLQIKAIEYLLYILGSEFMANVIPNHRNTLATNARSNGLIQGERETVGNSDS